MYPWNVKVRLNNTAVLSSGASIILQIEAMVGNDGMAAFQNLGVNMPMSSFQFEYYLDIPIGVNSSKFQPLNTVAPALSSSNPVLTCQVNEEGLVVNQASIFSITVSLIDTVTSQIVSNIAWQVNYHLATLLFKWRNYIFYFK